MASPKSSFHALLLLSDSALPLGSFAFSSGLESFLAHTKHSQTSPALRLQAFESFLEHSLHNVSSTAVPYILTAYHLPEQLETLDNDFDASTPCTVARRASVSQGRALLAVWERALSTTSGQGQSLEAKQAADGLTHFAARLKGPQPPSPLNLNGHFPPLFGTVCRALALSEQETTYLFLLSHAKTVLSAAVRASVMGPYQSQAVLASEKLQRWIATCIARQSRSCEQGVESAAVMVPTLDLWMGRHELLYSRIFNS